MFVGLMFFSKVPVCLSFALFFFCVCVCLQFQQSPLHFASLKGHAKICEVILGKGAAVNAQTEVKKNFSFS